MAAPVGAEPTVQTGASIDKFFGVFWTWSVMRFRVCARVWDRFFLSASLRLLPVPLVRAFAVPQGRVFFRLLGSRKNSKRKPGFALFFLLPYGVITENQLFKFFNHNCFEIVIKIIPL